MPGVLSWAMWLAAPKDSSQTTAKVWLDQPLWFLLWLQEAPQNNHQRENLEKKKKGLFLTGPRGTWEVLREQVWTWVLPLLRLAVVGPTVLRLHFYWWILNIRAGIKAQEWKSRQVVSRLSHWALSKKRSCTGGVAWSLCGYVFGNVLCGDSILPSGCLAIKKLNVRLSEYNKKNNNCQEFTL